VGLSAEHQLVIYWWCLWCKRSVYVIKDLADCWRECPPKTELEPPRLIEQANHHREDARFLESMGITLEEEPEA